jgi:HSP20 family molecular chaperone IbpA
MEGHAMGNQTEVTRSGSNDSLTKAQNGHREGTESALRPAVDIFETDDGITLRADMPGVSKDRLNLRVDGTNLVIEGRIKITPQVEMQPLYADVRSSMYRRSFLLSNEFESEKIDANLKDGVLTVRIPKRAELRPRRIEVRTS